MVASIITVFGKNPVSILTGSLMREELTKVKAPLSANSTICALITKEGTLNLSICKGEATKSGTQTRPENVRVLLREDENFSITYLVFYMGKTSSVSLASETSIDIEASNW